MSVLHSDRGITSIQLGVVTALALLLFFIVAFLFRQQEVNWLKSSLEQSMQKTQLLQTMRNDLLASAEAEKSSVMADTDEASESFAAQSIQASQHVEKARLKLARRLEGNSQEANLLHEFSRCWDKLQEIDREVLSLSVQNTNLKALRLSFTPAAEAIRQMENALNQLMDSVSSSPDAVSITRLASTAMIETLNIYTLQAPHIAEATETKMDEIETVMKRLDAQVTEALQRLRALVPESCKPCLNTAWAAYRDLQRINTEIVNLSHQNSNVRSYAISLGQKRKMAAQCQDVLVALEEMVKQNMMFKATR